MSTLWIGCLGKLSEKETFDPDFTLNFQALREQFSDADRIIIDILNKNGFTYHATFTPDTEYWQNQLPFHKDWTGISKYRLRYKINRLFLCFRFLSKKKLPA